MQSSAVIDSVVKTSEIGSEIQKLPTPPDSARSFYSATAASVTGTSGHHTARTMFYTPESSPGSAASVSSISSRHSPALENDGCAQQHREAFPNPTRCPTTHVDAEDVLVSPSECTLSLQSLALAACNKAFDASSSHVDEARATYSLQSASFLDMEGSQSLRTTDKIPAQHTAFRDEDHVFRGDVMSEAYELIPSLESPTSSHFCIAAPDPPQPSASAARFHERDDLCREAIDEFTATIDVPSSISNGRSDAMPLSSPPPHDVPTLVAVEPPVSTAPPIHVFSSGPFAFTSAGEARDIIPQLSTVLAQLQSIHGECSLDVLLTCTRLASAHHFVKDLVEAKRLYSKCLNMSARYAQLRVHLRCVSTCKIFFSVLGPQHVETRRIVVLLHDLELELRRQQLGPDSIAIVDCLSPGGRHSDKNTVSKNNGLTTARSSKKASLAQASSNSKHAPENPSMTPSASAHSPAKHPLGKSLRSRSKAEILIHEDRNANRAQPLLNVSAFSGSLQHKQSRPISPTFTAVPSQPFAVIETPPKNNPKNMSPPSAAARTSVSPTFTRFDPDVQSFSHVQNESVISEPSVSPTFSASRQFDAFSPRNSEVMLSNVKKQNATSKVLIFEPDVPNNDRTSSSSTLSPQVFDVESAYESSAAPVLPVATKPSLHIAEAASAATGFEYVLNAFTHVRSTEQRISWGGDDMNQKFISGQPVQLESVAQTNLLSASAQCLDDLNSSTMRNFMRHQLVERSPDLTQIFIPVTNTLACVLCDLNAGPSALGRRFSDNINQLGPEQAMPLSPRKVGQGKCLKVILLQPPQMQISELYSYESLIAQECFLYMNTESTVETIPCRDAVIGDGDGSNTEFCRLSHRLSMNEFLQLAGTICAWNQQSLDHVCCILIDVVFGSSISALLLGMLSMVVGQCSDAEKAQKWLGDKGDTRQLFPICLICNLMCRKLWVQRRA
jgi:hypothetical protein